MKIIMAEHAVIGGTYKVGGQHFCEQFTVMGHNVFYFSGLLNIFYIRHLLKHTPETFDTKIMLSTLNPKKVKISNAKEIVAFTPLTFFPISKRAPFGNTRMAFKYSLKLTFPSIRYILKKFGFNECDILIVTSPHYLPLFEMVKAHKRFLRITDNIPKFQTVPSIIGDMLEWGCERADKVIVTAKTLIDDMNLQRFKEKIIHISNGVDCDFFNPEKNYLVPKEMAPYMGKTIVVYMGTITYWFDVALLAKAAEKFRDWIFLLIGNVSTDVSILKRFPNVIFLGKRAYETLPAYLKYSSIGIIPFKRLPVIDGVSPIKMYEYMAMGLPVVSTRWRELELANSPALLADDYEDFLIKLSEAQRIQKNQKDIFISFARQNSWRTKADTLLGL